MADRVLNLNQQIALLPAAIPDTVLDFLEDFNSAKALQSESSRIAFDPEYLKTHGDALQVELEQIRAASGSLLQIHVEQAGRDVPGGFMLKLNFEKGVRGVGLFTKLKERTILRVIFQAGDYSEQGLKELLKNPPPIQG